MASIQINRGNNQEINNTPITDGLILFNTTNKTIYMDNENTRDVYSGQLSNSSDVEIVNLSDGQIIIWDETNNKWKNTNRYFEINNLTDVNLNSLANGQILKYDETSGKWINTDYTINDLSNVNINLSTLADGQIIVYNATTNKWENSEVKGGHKILNDSGTILTQKDNLQFKGVYTQNNGDNTEVNICRQMTKAQMEAATGEAAKGFMEATDEDSDLPLTSDVVECAGGVSLTNKLSSMEQEIEDSSRAINPSNVSLTLTSGNNLSINKIDIRRNGEIAIIFLRLQATAMLSPNTEIEVGTFSGLNYIGHIGGAIVSNTDTSLIGGYAINASNKLYVNFNKTISTNTNLLLTIPCFVVTS